VECVVRRISATVAVVLAASIFAACGGSEDKSDDPLTVGGTSETVVITDNEFTPGNLQVPVGATVTFSNEGNAVHDAKDDDDRWETDKLSGDELDAVSFDEAGEYTYHCTLHPGMKARIVVVDS
jgi:plastocyanin